MTIFAIDNFTGELPRQPADRLPPGAAQVAKNCDFAHGELRSLKGLGTPFTCGVSPVRALFTDNGLRWFAWSVPARAYLHPTIDDTVGRVIYLAHGDGAPRVALAANMKLSGLSPTAPTQSWKLGVKSPSGVLSATVSGSPSDAENPTLETVSYVAVAINLWGEESAPSNPVTVEYAHGQTVALSIAHTPDATEQTLQGIVFYRTYAANQSADLFLLNATPVTPSGGVYAYNDATTATATTTTLQTAEWDPAPAGASNLTPMGNGFFVVGAGRDLVFSEPYRPHAWPYRMTLPHGVVGIVPVEGGALVTTQAQTYLISGSHPEQVSQQLLPVEQAGWSDTAMTRVEGSAVYASNDGLVDVFGGQPSLKSSQQLFTRRDWQSRFGSVRDNLRLASRDLRVLGFVDPSYPSAASADAFLIDLSEGGSYCRLDVGQPIYGAAVSGTTDELYVGTATGAAPFGTSSTDLALEWWSGDALFPAPVAFAAAIVEAVGNFSLAIYGDGELLHTEAITGDKAFRLPAVRSRKRWSVRITGTGTIRRFHMGASFAELRNI